MHKEIFRLANITEYDTFLDIGHGIGNACLQAAYTQGCKVKGIELVHERNIIANVFKDNFEVILNRMEKDEKKVSLYFICMYLSNSLYKCT